MSERDSILEEFGIDIECGEPPAGVYERDWRAFRMYHGDGVTFREVGLALGVGKERARALVRRAWDHIVNPPAPPTEPSVPPWSLDTDSVEDQVTISVRTRMALSRADIHRVPQLMAMTDDEILSVPRIGPKGLSEISDILAERRAAPPPRTLEQEP